MIKKFRDKLKKEGRSLIWFYNKHKTKINREYASFVQQVGGFAALQEDVEKVIRKYISEV